MSSELRYDRICVGAVDPYVAGEPPTHTESGSEPDFLRIGDVLQVRNVL